MAINFKIKNNINDYLKGITARVDLSRDLSKTSPFIIHLLWQLFDRSVAGMAQTAFNSWQLCNNHHAAALCLTFDYHTNVKKIDHQAARVSETIWTLIGKEVEIHKKRKEEASNYLHCGEALLIGLLALSIGYYAGNRLIQKAARIALLGALFFYGYIWNSHRADHEAIDTLYKEIQTLKTTIEDYLKHYDANMCAIVAKENPLFTEVQINALQYPSPAPK